MKKHSAAHIEACRKARIEDAYQIQMQYGYDTIAEAYHHLPTVTEYANRTAPGRDPRIERQAAWIEG